MVYNSNVSPEPSGMRSKLKTKQRKRSQIGFIFCMFIKVPRMELDVSMGIKVTKNWFLLKQCRLRFSRRHTNSDFVSKMVLLLLPVFVEKVFISKWNIFMKAWKFKVYKVLFGKTDPMRTVTWTKYVDDTKTSIDCIGLLETISYVIFKIPCGSEKVFTSKHSGGRKCPGKWPAQLISIKKIAFLVHKCIISGMYAKMSRIACPMSKVDCFENQTFLRMKL